jgi:hypothetical protein
VHDPGRVLVDVAVMLADGGEAISDLAVLRDQPELFGSLASTATAWGVVDGVDPGGLARSELGRCLLAATAGGRELAGLVIDVDASLVVVIARRNRLLRRSRAGLGTTRCWSS